MLSERHPRPHLQRSRWDSLDGRWEFALDREARWSHPDEVAWERSIFVPFAPETLLSGVHEEGFFRSCWYRRDQEIAPAEAEERIFLHFGAVDFAASVWVDGALAGHHVGGYTPFSFDITELPRPGAMHEIVVHAEDDPHDLTQPRGKQDWQPQPHSIWYPRTTGIWQTVWLERRPATWIDALRWTPHLATYDIGCAVAIGGERRDDLRLEVVLSVATDDGRRILAHDQYGIISGEVQRRIAIADPGIDDFRNELLWSPRSPVLIDAALRLFGADGGMIDEVFSYTALRSVGADGDRFLLNGRPLQLRMVLDQGYWPDSGLTPPDDDAFRRDVEVAKAMGFNGVRKHQKIEDPRYLYWADRLGLLVWEEMPSAYRFTTRSIDHLTREWKAAVMRDVSHPCIVTWVPFNESWGVPDLPSEPAQRDYVQALYHLTKALDPSRPVIANDGWESGETDMIGVHDYDHAPARIRQRYESNDDVVVTLGRTRLSGRLVTLAGHEPRGQPIVLSEFGGIAYAPRDTRGETWGYSEAISAEGLAAAYEELLRTVHELPLLAGFCYTQFADTYQEANGLLFADRSPKFPLEQIALATEGAERRRATQHEQREQRDMRGSVSDTAAAEREEA
jgi:beta-galactosidase/beta-glucuronidase